MNRTDLKNAARATLQAQGGPVTYYRLSTLQDAGLVNLPSLPFTIRILLENMLRKLDGYLVRDEDVATVAGWNARALAHKEVPFMPGRVLMQDLTGVPAVVDLAAMRAATVRRGGDPKMINPLIPVDLVIDHSVQVDYYGNELAFARNVEKEFERNGERYALLRWAQQAFENFRVVPPGTGICHQVNLEYLSSVVMTQQANGETVAFPDTLVGMDSHTTMVNGLAVLGWGVGGIEAEAVMLGQPYYMMLPEVIGFKLEGSLPDGATATDLVLTVTEMLRRKGVVDKFVEFYGPGLSRLPLPDRATIANMAPEYGATCGFFPVDQEALRYLAGTGREAALVDLVERYTKEQHLFRTDSTPDPEYTDTLFLDMGTVEPSLAGPRRPQDRVVLGEVKPSFQRALVETFGKPAAPATAEAARANQTATAVADWEGVPASRNTEPFSLDDGAVVIAAITSCTNTSNPSVMIGAGLLAKKAVERGLASKPWVKTSMAPGSRVVSAYLDASGLTPYLDQLGFHVVGYGCTTCIGNSGPLPDPVAKAVGEQDLVAAAVLSGNRNFEGRIHALVKANYLASPMLVVAYALAGSMQVDLTREPLGQDRQGQPVYLPDVWPSQAEIRDAVGAALSPELFRSRYGEVFEGDDRWKSLPVPRGDLFVWDPDSTYVREAPYFLKPSAQSPLRDITGARVLALLGDSITTDHISPAGAIPLKSPAGQYLQERGVQPPDFNTYGARRGNHEVMVRGTFGNIRLKNHLTPDAEGDWTVHIPTGERLRIYDASVRYQDAGIPLIVIGGKEYGQGSSRDWAAKGPLLLGVKAVLVETFERIHRSNLVGMGVLPLQFKPGQNAASLGLTGLEAFDVLGISDDLRPGQDVTVRARMDGGGEITFQTTVRIDAPVEIDYYKQGGVLQTVLERLLAEHRN